jgi:hypothetical protein
VDDGTADDGLMATPPESQSDSHSSNPATSRSNSGRRRRRRLSPRSRSPSLVLWFRRRSLAFRGGDRHHHHPQQRDADEPSSPCASSHHSDSNHTAVKAAHAAALQAAHAAALQAALNVVAQAGATSTTALHAREYVHVDEEMIQASAGAASPRAYVDATNLAALAANEWARQEAGAPLRPEMRTQARPLSACKPHRESSGNHSGPDTIVTIKPGKPDSSTLAFGIYGDFDRAILPPYGT